VVAPWPVSPTSAVGRPDPDAEAEIAALQRLVTQVRRFRADQGLRPGQKVAARLGGIELTPLAGHAGAVRSLARLEQPGDGFTASARLAVGDVAVELDLSGAIDVPAERKRLAKELAAAHKEVDTATAKLGNQQFLGKAPAEVVDRIRVRLAEAEAEIARVQSQLDHLPTG